MKKQTMEQVLRENKTREQIRKIKEIKLQEKHNKVQFILFMVIASFILITFITIMNTYTNDAISNCVADGNNYNYCVSKLS